MAPRRGTPLRSGPLRRLAAGVLAVTLLAGAAVGAGPDAPFQSNDRLIALLRLRDLEETSRRLEVFLRRIHPRTPIRDPLQSALAPVLRNPGLRQLRSPAFVELLAFHAPEGEGLEAALAFPVEDPEEYRALLSAQADISEEATVGEITVFREERREGEPVRFYLAFTHERILLFGFGRAPVAAARALYLEADAGGLWPDTPPGLSARLHVRRLAGIYEGRILAGLRRFRQDLLADLFDAARPENAVDRAVDAALRDLYGLVRQVGFADARLRVDEEGVHLGAWARPTAEELSFLHHFFSQVPAEAPALAGRLPAGTEGFYATRLWPDFWRTWLESAGELLATAFGGVITPEVRREVEDTVDALGEAVPLETAVGLLPPPTEERARGLLVVRLVRWKRPERFPAVLDRLARLLSPGPVTELLERNGLKFTFQRTEGVADADGVRIDRLRLHLRPTGDRSLGGRIGFLGAPRDFFLARVGETTAILSGASRPTERDPEAEEAERTRRIETLRGVIAGLRQRRPTLSGTETYRRATRTTPDGAFALFAANPLGYIRTAMVAAADWRPVRTLGREAAERRRDARRFERYEIGDAPAVLSLQVRDGAGGLEFFLPLAACRNLSRALLGIAIAEEATGP